MRLDGEQWNEYFESFEREAFRLETLPTYSVAAEEDEYAAFLATGRLELPDDDPWLTKVDSTSGLSVPLSGYATD
ncbi:DUF6879 family protein [Streptomyces sp. SID3343]|uniref:DUF6879 family protein n=1 Tax=Streptomyces sp. SID3343 TaxID=2690260 RepID=UPI001368E7FC|nr:DUF6879 family protein [Streptomyces sp. SID3343]MYW00885.1 hypothetical protein [Streptomyces sp. SID3343]